MVVSIEHSLTLGQAAETISFFLNNQDSSVANTLGQEGWRAFGDSYAKETNEFLITVAPEAVYQPENPDQKAVDGKDLELLVFFEVNDILSQLLLMIVTNIDNLNQIEIRDGDGEAFKETAEYSLLVEELEKLALILVNMNQEQYA